MVLNDAEGGGGRGEELVVSSLNGQCPMIVSGRDQVQVRHYHHEHKKRVRDIYMHICKGTQDIQFVRLIGTDSVGTYIHTHILTIPYHRMHAVINEQGSSLTLQELKG